jgi:organic radical activating enzyme
MIHADASVFHLHPLQRCNLHCQHCYSDSSPQATALLAPARARAAVKAAAGWGYGTLAISGGEPMLYPGLGDLLSLGNDLGMATTIVTNGLLCRTRQEIDRVRHARTVTVSVDGLTAQHDAMRARKGACRGAADAVRRMADAGMAVWVACGVTALNVEDIEELAQHAASWGARGINFHLVEPAGRAATLAPDLFLSPEARALLYVTIALLAAARVDSFALHLDLVHRTTVLRNPALLYAFSDAVRPARPADAIRVLVMYPHGALLPVCHGFNPRFAAGVFDDCASATMWPRFFEDVFPALTALARRALHELDQAPQHQVVNPGDWLAQRSLRGVLPPQAA